MQVLVVRNTKWHNAHTTRTLRTSPTVVVTAPAALTLALCAPHAALKASSDALPSGVSVA